MEGRSCFFFSARRSRGAALDPAEARQQPHDCAGDKAWAPRSRAREQGAGATLSRRSLCSHRKEQQVQNLVPHDQQFPEQGSPDSSQSGWRGSRFQSQQQVWRVLLLQATSRTGGGKRRVVQFADFLILSSLVFSQAVILGTRISAWLWSPLICVFVGKPSGPLLTPEARQAVCRSEQHRTVESGRRAVSLFPRIPPRNSLFRAIPSGSLRSVSLPLVRF